MLTAEEEGRLIALYASGETVRQIAQHFNVTLQTVYNVLGRNNVSKRSTVITGLVEKLIEAVKMGTPISIAAERLGISESAATRAIRKCRQAGSLTVTKGRPRADRTVSRRAVSPSTLLDEADTILGVAFPFSPVPSQADVARELDRLRAVECRLDGDTIRPQSTIGLSICDPFFPNRFSATSRLHRQSAYAAWHDVKAMKAALAFQKKCNHPTTPRRVLRALMLKCRTPTIFRPAVAKLIYERFCRPGGFTWDPCSGYGGRLLGAVAAGVRYIGTEIDPATVDGNRRLAQMLDVSAEIHHMSATAFDPPAVDLVFTSPPYFDRERYSISSDETWRGHTVESWFRNFMRPVAERAQRALPAGGHFVINIADLSARGGKRVPLVQMTIETAHAAGFEHTKTLRMPLAAINRVDPFEPILVFRKL